MINNYAIDQSVTLILFFSKTSQKLSETWPALSNYKSVREFFASFDRLALINYKFIRAKFCYAAYFWAYSVKEMYEC